jgi:tetratricopeptide (TPR) repeat protein
LCGNIGALGGDLHAPGFQMKRFGASNSKLFWICCAVFLISAALVKPAQDHLERRLGAPGPEPDLLYFNSPSILKRMALGYDRLLADFYWMRVIQYYGRRDEADRRMVRYRNLAALLDITTTLDPDLMDAYHAGTTFLAEPEPVGAGQPSEAIKLLEKGIRNHPQEWKLWYEKGFVYYLYLKDYPKAAESWQAGSRLENAPHFLGPLAAIAYTEGGALEVALALWNTQYRESTRADVKENARNHILSIEVAQDLWSLEYLVEKYQAKTGILPQSLQELVRGKKHSYRIVDPLGTPYSYNAVTGAVSLGEETKIRYLKLPYSYKEQFQSRIDE